MQKILLTGASGFVGRHFVSAMHHKYKIFCLARRSQIESGIAKNKNIVWIQADLKDQNHLENIADYLQKKHQGIDYVLHLAGYYDFSQKSNPAYRQTNILGTKRILDLALSLQAKRFIFSSSLAACNFTAPGEKITKNTPPAAEFPYAWSKREAEKIISEYSSSISCTVLRLAAVFSDWCEYPPLYSLLETWLSKSLVSRFLGGKGQFALPYIHVKDICKLFEHIMHIHDSLPNFAIYNASPAGCVSLEELYKTATRYYLNLTKRPFYVPQSIAWPAVAIRYWLGKLLGREPFERPWMVGYIDKRLDVDPSKTYQELGWQPTPRYHILRRLLFLMENKKMYPNNWRFRNSLWMERVAIRKNIELFNKLQEIKEQAIKNILEELKIKQEQNKFENRIDHPEFLNWYVSFIYELISSTVLHRDRSIISDYIRIICPHRLYRIFDKQEITNFLKTFAQVLGKMLLDQPNTRHLNDKIHNYIDLTMQYTIDEIEDIHEDTDTYHLDSSREKDLDFLALHKTEEFKKFMLKLENICGENINI